MKVNENNSNEYLASLVSDNVPVELDKKSKSKSFTSKAKTTKAIDELFGDGEDPHKRALMAHVNVKVYEYIQMISRTKGLSKSKVTELILEKFIDENPLV